MIPAERKCATCGAGVGRGLRFCKNCGTELGEQAELAMPPVVRRLLGRQPDNPRAAWFHLGAVLLGQNRRGEARSALEQARLEPGTEPSDAEIEVLRAWALVGPDGPAMALQSYLDACLLDPSMVADILPAAESLLSVAEARVLGPWIRSTWLPRLRESSDVDIRVLALFRTRVAVLMGEAAEAAEALADALRAGTPADELAALPDAPLSEAEWSLLLGMALARLGEDADARRFVAAARAGQLPESGPFGAAEALVAEADLTEDTEDADAKRYEAAGLFTARGEHDRAIALYERAAVSWGEAPDLHWTWADTIRLATYGRRDVPAIDVYARIMARWSAGTVLALPDESSAWAFLVPAFACENLAWNDPGRPREQLWHACLWAERTLVFDERNVPALLLLTRCHRQLENYALAAVSVQVALDEQLDGVTDASDEYANLLGFLNPDEAAGRFAEAAERGGTEDQRARWSLALTYAQLGRDAEALEQLELLTPDPADAWQLWAYGWVQRMAGKDEDAAVRFTQLREATAADESWTWCRAYAAFGLGDYETAATEMEAALDGVDRTINRRHDYLVLAGLSRLAQGRVEDAERRLLDAVGLLRATWDALDGVADLRGLAERYDGAVAETATRLAGVFTARAAELVGQPLDTAAARAELTRVAAESDGVTRIAALATLARLSTTEQVTVAVDAYRSLLEWDDVFPEAAIGLFQAGVIHIDEAIEDLAPDEAIERIGSLRPALVDRTDPRIGMTGMNLNAREAFARFWLGDVEGGHARFAETVSDIGALADSAGEEIASFWVGLVPGLDAYWRVADTLALVPDEEAAAAAGQLTHYLDQYLGCVDDQQEPDFMAYEVRLGPGLVPADGLGESRLIAEELLLGECQRLEAELGVLLPQVTVSDDPLFGRYEYRIELWGSTLGIYFADPDDPEPEVTVATRFGEAVRTDLPLVACVDLAEQLRLRWQAEWPELTERAVPDDAALVALSDLLRAVLAYGVPVVDGRAVLEEFADGYPDRPVAEVVDRYLTRLPVSPPDVAPAIPEAQS